MYPVSTSSIVFQVNVSLAYRRGDVIATRRGTALPVEVQKRCGASFLAFASKSKHAVFNKKLVDLQKEYVLLFHDHEEVLTLPGTNEPFCLEKYQSLIGKRFHRMNFLLCEKAEFEGNTKSSNCYYKKHAYIRNMHIR